MSDEFLIALPIPPPIRGVLEGLDPALAEEFFPITAAQDLQNLRVAGGRWATRAGSGGAMGSLDAPLSGATRLFAVVYEADGSPFRLIARGENTGAALYDFEVDVDLVWTAVSGGTGLGTTTLNQPYFHGIQVGEAFYLTDRLNALKKYVTSGSLASVTIPAAPSTAPGVKAWTYAVLERWTGGGTLGWTESASGRFDISDGSGTLSPPTGTGVGRIAIADAAVEGDTIRKDVTGEDLNSHTIAFWIWGSSTARKWFQFGLGLTEADQFPEPMFVTKAETWWPVFINVGNLPEINFKRFKCIFSPGDTRTFYFSEMVLPGRLSGFYRWVYTHYNPTTGHESGISPVSHSGEALDFSTVGVSRTDGQAVGKAFQKSAMLTFTSDTGTDAATTKIRIYRSGGVDTLTTGPDGRSIWLRVGEVLDLSNKLNGGHSAADTTLDVDSGTGFAADQWIVIAKGTATEEYQKIVSVASNTLTVTPGLINNQSDDAAVQVAFLDNVGNEAIDVLADVDEERDSPPSGAHWVAKAPDGRLWLFRTSPTEIAVSNKPTPLRPNDMECFPDDVDPYTRSSPTQGWRFTLGSDAAGEEIVWGGFYRGLAHVLTRNKMFRVHALSQADWGPNAVQKVLDIGCISGHSVQQLDGYLYWVAEGPRVVRWSGEGPVEVLSHQTVNVRLKEADEAGTNNAAFWFAVVFETVQGKYYGLFYNFQDTEGGCIQRLDYNITQNAWEPVQWFDGNGLTKGWNAGLVWDGGTDSNQCVGVTYRGDVLELDAETEELDSGNPIQIAATTKRIPLGFVGQAHELFVRLAGVTDTLSFTVTMGGSDYGTTSDTYEVSTAGSGDQDIQIPIARTVKGRWLEITLSGSVSNRPAVRELVAYVKPIRERKSANG